MGVFKEYSNYYNLLYKDKDYDSEAKYIESLIKKYAKGAKSILDLGCGTGKHAYLLSNKKFSLHGVDLSEDMLVLAGKLPKKNNLSFSCGDARSVRLNKKFDVVVSLFHVMSYQITNQDIEKAFLTAYEHLNNNGIFIFDCWYGPAVLSDRPSVRIKRLGDKETEITRIAEPVLHANENIVDVNYQVFIRNKQNNSINILNETHKMRYLFKPEIELFLNNANLKILAYKEWMAKNEPDFHSWNVVIIAKK